MPEPPHLSFANRAARLAIAVVGTAAFSWSAIFAFDNPRFGTFAVLVGLCAALSWPALCLALARCIRREFGPLASAFDLCLRVMTVGMVFLFFLALTNTLAALTPAPDTMLLIQNLALLIAADALMGFRFALESKRLGVSRLRALTLWIALQNGLFLTLLAAGAALTWAESGGPAGSAGG